MARANLTLQLDTDVIRQARVLAAKRGTSISALAASQLQALVEEEQRFGSARERAEAVLDLAVARGGRRWARTELHDRDLPAR